MSKSLTTTEIYDLEICEEIIEKGKKTFVEVGIALTSIQDRKLYRKDYDTFEAYCQVRWGWSRQRGQQLIAAAKVVASLPKDLASKVPNESASRELSKTSPKTREEVLKIAASSGKPVSASSIRNATTVVTNHPIESGQVAKTIVKQTIELDNEGEAITKEALPYWNRRQEVRDIMTQISRLKGVLEGHAKSGDKMLGWVANSAVPELSKAYQSVSNALPHAVCTNCQGHPVIQKCTFCNGTGLIPKWRYDTQANEEVKNIRKKAHELRAS